MQPEQTERDTPQPGGITPDALLTTLRESVDEVLETMVCRMAKLEASAGPPHDAAKISLDRVDIEATVGISGDHTGTIVLGCTALDITRGLLMLEDSEPIELDDIKDAIGECANMLGGTLKTKALDAAGSYSLGIPTVATHVNQEGRGWCGTLVYN